MCCSINCNDVFFTDWMILRLDYLYLIREECLANLHIIDKDRCHSIQYTSFDFMDKSKRLYIVFFLSFLTVYVVPLWENVQIHLLLDSLSVEIAAGPVACNLLIVA